MVGVISTAQYAYAYGWVSALPQSLGKEAYERLILSRSVEEIVASLEGTAYSEEVSLGVRKHPDGGGMEVDIREIEKAITKSYVDICKNVISALPMGVRDGARAVMMDEWDVVNIKRVLRGIVNGMSGEKIMMDIGAIGNIKEETLNEMASGDLRSALEKINQLGYALDTTETYLFEIESMLDRILIARWLREVEKIKDLRDIVGIQIDMYNLRALLRHKLSNIDTSKFMGKTVVGRYLNAGMLNEIASAAGGRGIVDSLMDILSRTHYGGVFQDALENFKKTGSFEKLELEIEKSLSGFVLQEMPLTLGYIISYLRRMRIDARNIRVMLVCKSHEIEPEEIRELVVF
ncbi:MAG: hypothetical protein A7316_09885 [Candidatus Altiarchaeales archaeon WOR_SM1_86-2]|nr:MAG: hypothetical protein A7316_09885 [Candidatus Altiarchaeales archaeon WOR_SM1_86-2]